MLFRIMQGITQPSRCLYTVWKYAKLVLSGFAGLADRRYASGALTEDLGDYVDKLCRQKGIIQETQALRAGPYIALLPRLLRQLLIPVCLCLGLRVRNCQEGGIIVGT